MTETAIVTGARAPVALHLARLLHASGRRVILADTLRWPMSRATRSKTAYERLPPPVDSLDAYAAAWVGLMERWEPNIIVPTCEDVFHLAAVRDIAGVAIPLFAPSLALLTRVHDKNVFAQLARGLGADPPATIRLATAADVAALDDDDLVLKPVWSRFGSRTLIRPGRAQRAAVTPTAADPWVAQTHLPGEEICAYAVAVGADVRAMQVYRPLWRAGLGAAVAFEPITDTGFTAFVAGFCARVGWTGQIAFDARRDANGGLHVIECNPRPTSGVHFFGATDGLADAIAGSGRANASGTEAMTLPLAMATYGLTQALGAGRIHDWWRDMRTMGDIAAWPGEGGLLGAQLKALAEIAGIAARRRKGLRAASTDDIEWNGNGFKR